MVTVDAIDVVEEKIEETQIKKWIFGFKVRSYSYTPAPSCIDTTQQWLVSAYNQEHLTKELTRKEPQHPPVQEKPEPPKKGIFRKRKEGSE